MIWLSLAFVVLGSFGLVGFRWWLQTRYQTPDASTDLGPRVARTEERLATLELQRGITRKVAGT